MKYFQDVLNRPAHEFGNDETVETLWAMKAMDHVIVYFNVHLLKYLSSTYRQYSVQTCLISDTLLCRPKISQNVPPR